MHHRTTTRFVAASLLAAAFGTHARSQLAAVNAATSAPGDLRPPFQCRTPWRVPTHVHGSAVDFELLTLLATGAGAPRPRR